LGVDYFRNTGRAQSALLHLDQRMKYLITITLLLLSLQAQANNPQIVKDARTQIGVTKTYDPAYVRLPFPNGDVPMDRGVCSDVVIRALRKQSVDLQQKVNQDMRANFSVYPKIWGLRKADSNIDHRRVPNLETFFRRQNKEIKTTGQAQHYQPGDVVSWDLNGRGLTHIGIVSDRKSADGKRYLVIHNIGAGAREEDVLFAWKQRGHFRWF
jgi:uncharacterized protein